MSEVTPHKISKWPFLIGDALLVCTGFLIMFRHAPADSIPHMLLAVLCLIAGATAGVLPFVLEYRVTARLAEAGAVGTVMAQLQGIEQIAAQIRSATENWQNIQEQSDKTAVSAKEIAERMTAEVQAFGDFMQRINENEKANLRLEVEKLRRAENDWLQVLVRTLDHVYALHKGAVRSKQPGLIEQITNFQSACREAARRVGLTPFLPTDGETFDAAKHQLVQGEAPPAADGKIRETVASGYTFQGRLLRPALVRLGNLEAAPDAEVEPMPAPQDPQGQLGIG